MIVQSWDMAIKAGAGHDASACATFYYGPPMGEVGTAEKPTARHHLIDMAVMKLEYPDLRRKVLELRLRNI